MDIEYRIKKYVGNIHSDFLLYENDLELDPFKGVGIYSFNKYRGNPFPEINGTYYHDMTRCLSLLPHLHDSRFLFFVGDTYVPYSNPTIVKTRPISGFENCVLMDLDHPRHFNPLSIVDQNDIPYHEKKDRLVWRGATTGPGFNKNQHNPRHTSRAVLVARHANTKNKHLDIGLNELTNTVKKYQGDYYSNFLKPSIPLSQMLSYKFHLSVEGHDVATNLKWVLYSNSVPFCPPFYVQSWILEDELVPWTHYIPVKGDYSDLDDKVEWALNHDNKCEKIAQEGRAYMEQFMDTTNESRIRKSVFETYTKHVKII
jgi:hypothetical protein